MIFDRIVNGQIACRKTPDGSDWLELVFWEGGDLAWADPAAIDLLDGIISGNVLHLGPFSLRILHYDSFRDSYIVTKDNWRFYLRSFQFSILHHYCWIKRHLLRLAYRCRLARCEEGSMPSWMWIYPIGWLARIFAFKGF